VNLVIRHAFDCEVFAEVSINEVIPYKLPPPIAITSEIVGVNGFVNPAMYREVSLTVTVQIQFVHHNPAGHRLLIDTRTHRSPFVFHYLGQGNVD
jgi:hypothetical protein